MLIQLDYTSHTCINIHVYNDEKQVLFNRDFGRENFAEPTTFQPMSSSLQPAPSLQVFRPPPVYLTWSGPYWYPASTLGDLVAAAIATILVTSKQTQSLYIQ